MNTTLLKKMYVYGILILFGISSLFAIPYQIKFATYYSNGITQSVALRREVPIDTKRLFKDQQELDIYIADIVQQLNNLRALENVTSNYVILDEENGVIPIDLSITVTDSRHFLALPKFSYDSNSGTEIKIKAKDSNFLGLLNTFNFDFNFNIDQDSETDTPDYVFGINFDYSYPFNIWILNNSWNNDFSFDWTYGNDKPEFSYTTGFSTSLPFGQHSFNLNFNQSIKRDEDYEVYGDAIYAVENASMSLPLTLGEINNTVKVKYTPSVSFTYNWDLDSISTSDSDLIGPSISFSQALSTGRVNWLKNFRYGFSASCSQSLSWNFETETIVPSLSCTAEYFKAFKYAGICTKLYVTEIVNSSTKVGGELRGIRDYQYFANGSDYALKTPEAIVFNFDFPIHIITTHWLDWSYALFGSFDTKSKPVQFLFWIPHKLFKYLDFEVQFSPFIDTALTYNYITGNHFDYKDGFYAAGVEVLIYPSKWRSYVIRTSLGVDVGRLLLSDYLNMEWRNNSISKYEFYFGLGLQY